MEPSKNFLLLIGIYCVTLVREVHSECCSSYAEINFRMENGSCDMVGGTGDSICDVSICADGMAKTSAFCGQGACNIFGCNCDGGCRTGDWSRSFKQRNKNYGIDVLTVSWTPFPM
ncbi:protein Diedel-like [Drosophila serrata]|uniref:protein Diedel-like n=1 Tax=Drosophila serrata TaxID=7274 RepID=UPI000A1D2460|nr:protein Diedel-like [Drosophila serrata]